MINTFRYTFRRDSLGWFDCDQDAPESETYVLASDFERVEAERDIADEAVRNMVGLLKVRKAHSIELEQAAIKFFKYHSGG